MIKTKVKSDKNVRTFFVSENPYNETMAKFYVIATPIGNLEDITLRALRVLGEVDIIFCEDTRVTKKLLDHYDISKPVQSYHAHSKSSKEEKIIELLREEKNLALVSDAGTPCISDPGSKLVNTILETQDLEVKVIPIPGPSAIITTLQAAGVPCNHFEFLGFVPQKKGRETFFTSLEELDHVAVFYESSHRILKTLASLEKHAPKHTVVIGRELTKMFEEIVRGTAAELTTHLTETPEKQKGEFVVLLKP